MKTFSYSAIAHASVLDFDPRVDVLVFDSSTLSAADLTLSVIGSGDAIQFTTPTKTFTLDGASFSMLDSGNVTFANGSKLVNSTAANLYSDALAGGTGNDLLIGGATTMPIARASVSTSGLAGNGTSLDSSLSADGRYVAFQSFAGNLVSGDYNNKSDIFVRDLASGTLTRVSTTAAGHGANGSNSEAALSADGHSVAFTSGATNLLAGGSGYQDIYIKDLATGSLTRVSTTSAGAAGNAGSSAAALSEDARVVAFQSFASNLVAGDTNAAVDIFVKDVSTGALTRVSANYSGVEANADSYHAALNADGTRVAFESYATNLVVNDTNATIDVFVNDLSTEQLIRVSTTASGGQANNSSGQASLSGDGRYVAFHSDASNLVAGDTNDTRDVFVKDLQTGAIQLVSTGASGNLGNSASYNARISADGRYVVFQSFADNLVGGDTNNNSDVFVKDLATGAITRLSASAAGVQGDNASYNATISADGARVAFDSTASNLVPSASSPGDVFVTSNILESHVLTGGAGNDTYLISRTQDQVVEAAGGGTDSVRSTISYVLPTNVERLELIGEANLNATGNSLANTLVGNSGDNVLDGGAGIDTVSYANAAAGVTIDLGSSDVQDTVGAGLDTLRSIENLTGSSSDDVLFGNATNNTLDGGAGADLLIGGAGSDFYVVDNVGDQVIEETGTAVDVVRASLSWVLGANLEMLQLLGNANLNATGNALDNQLWGNRGNNVLNGGAGTDTASYTYARAGVTVGLDKTGPQSTVGAGADTLVSIENLTGSNYADTLHGNAGTNVLNGGGGVDTLSYARATAAVTVSIGTTVAQATGGAGTDTVIAFENLTGSAFNDTLGGGGGANVLNGGSGNDTMSGAAGDDTYVVDSALDVVTEIASGGIDTVVSGVTRTLGTEQENLTLSGGAAIDATGNSLANVLTGNAGTNVLNGGTNFDTVNYAGATAAVNANLSTGVVTGGGGNDSLVSIEAWIGSRFADTIVGNNAANILTGGAGADTLTGGVGIDRFVFTAMAGADTITDFVSSTDLFQVSQSALAVGDGDTLVEGAMAVAGPGSFSSSAELVVVTTNISGAITNAKAAAVVGNASSAYALGRTALFVVDNGASSAAYLFSSLDSNATVSADELTLLAMLGGTAQTSVADYAFLA